MPIDHSNLLAQVNRALEMYDAARRVSGYDDLSSNNYSNAKRHEVLNVLISTLQRVAPKSSSYWSQFSALSQSRPTGLGPGNLSQIVGILRALKLDLEAGLVTEFEELIHADIFGDFLDMAEYLLDSNFKDASAVMIGSVLEEHLRKLAQKNSIPLMLPSGAHKKADALNNELASAPVYNRLEQKNITAWLDLRNKAAHGQYSEYVREQVSAMLQGVRSFIARLPA